MTRALVLVPCLLLGCTNPLPGEPVGTYRVVMRLEENTCGPRAVILQDGKNYSVELRADNGRGYWHVADHAPIQGTLDANGAFKFTASSLVASEGPDAGPNQCRLVQDEVLSGSLRTLTETDASAREGGMADAHVRAADPGDAGAHDAGASDKNARDASTEADTPNALVGEHILRISGYAGTDCSRALLASGGPFEALPCVVRYTLRGTERGPL